MGIRTDPLEPLLTSLNAVKNAYTSVDVGIRKAVSDLEFHMERLDNKMGLCVSGYEDGECRRNFWIREWKNNGEPSEDRHLQNDVNLKFGCSKKDLSIWGNRGMNELTICGNGFTGSGGGKDGAVKICIELGLMWSAVANTFSHALITPIMGNKMFQIDGNAAGVSACLKSDSRDSGASLAYKQCKKEDTHCELVGVKGKKDKLLDLSVGFLFDHVCQSLQQIHHTMIANETDVLTRFSSFVSKTSIEAKESRLMQNLRFAKINVPPTSSVKEVVYAIDEKSDCKITRNAEIIEPSSSRNLSTGSLSELTGVGKQLEHLLQDHPEQKKLLSQQDSFKYTKSEVANRIIGSESESSSVEVAAPANEQTENVLKSALAGGFSCALSAFIMHPVDTVKTQVQASTLSLPEIISKIPEIGTQGLYMGIVPAVVGQFSSHGLRTGICETIKFILVNVAPTMPDIQVESASSFCGTILGTTTRIPSEVLKQRLQAGLYKNMGEAIIGTWKQDGVKAFFRGTGATLCREIPFYVAGMGLYTESKKAVQRLIGRPLEPWEIIVVGAVSGGLAAVTTTPFDVIKTRMMIATGGSPVSMSAIALSILQQEGPLGLFKGAVPRFFWVAPLGAMNFAGYELARKALG